MYKKTKKLRKSKGYKLRRKFLDKNIYIIRKLYPTTKTIYGPYLNQDGRYRVVMYTGKKRFTTQYCSLKIEVKLKRRLGKNETVDHKNMNVRDDRYDNLQILSRTEHAKQDVLRIKKQKVKCIWCDSSFLSKGHKVNPNKSIKRKAGPFCSRKCSGQYGASVQNGGIQLKRIIHKRAYYRLKTFN